MKLRFYLIFLVYVGIISSCTQDEKITVVQQINTETTNDYYLGNKPPLKPNPLLQIPLGGIQAEGWLKTQLELMTDGYTGRLVEISSFLSDESGWLGGDERGWEEAPYWLRGFYDLSVLTENQRVDTIAQRWIESVVNSVDRDGYYGSIYNKMVISANGKDSLVDLWPHMVMNDVLISYYEATNDNRIIPLMTEFFRFCNDLEDETFLPQMSWDYYENYGEQFGDWKPRIQIKRAGDFIPQVYWLYNHTGDVWLLDFALRIYQKTQPPLNQWLDNHVVHFMQRFRYPAQMFPLTGDDFYLNQTNFFYDQMMQTWGQMPRGAFAADERIRDGKIDPLQGFESCGIVEGNKSFYILGDITGQTEYADKIEDLTFNWLPASHTSDLKALRYLTAANMIQSVPKMDYQNQGDHPVFAASMHRCCQHNTAMGWPWFIKNMWKASPDNGLVAWLYGPNEVDAFVGEKGAAIKIISSTEYPFSDEINLQLNLDEKVVFPLYLRIPGWADKLVLKINGEKRTIEKENGRYIKMERKWKNNDRVSIEFKPKITFTVWPRTKSISVNRGPFTYSVRIRENWVKKEIDKFGWDIWEISPLSDWNYGIPVGKFETSDVRIKISKTMPDQPWSATDVPIVLEIPAKKIPGWKASVKNTVDPLREGPVRSDEKTEWIEMIPMGAAHLRLTCLPVISEENHARYWENIPDPNHFMLERLTH